MNQLFGYQILPEDNPDTIFEFKGTDVILPNQNNDCLSSQIMIFTHRCARLQSYYSKKYNTYAYIWGIPVHPEIPAANIMEWCISVILSSDYKKFRELIGTFVLIIDDPSQRKITFVSDILGVRPFFLGNYKNRMVFGSRAWPLYLAGLSTGAINYDAVSSWVAYKYNLTDGTMFSDINRLPPGAVITCHDGKITEVPYATFTSSAKTKSFEQVANDLHDIVSYTSKKITSQYDHISCSLSGGYDSRYLVALSNKYVNIECATVSYPEEEGKVAMQVAETLGVPIECFPVSRSDWSLYNHDDVYHFMADGFPITKHATYFLTQKYPEVPMLNGFMGDPLMRGSRDTYLGKYETEWNGDLSKVLQRRTLSTNFRIFRRNISEHIKMRSLAPMEHAVYEGSPMGKVFFWSDLIYRQRFYISNNFLQHIDITEALMPFYSWELLNYKMTHHYKLFSRDLFDKIFQTRFPELARIPHASDLMKKNHNPKKSASCTRVWARELLPVIAGNKYLSLLKKKLSITYNLAGYAGIRRAEPALFLLKRLYIFEKSLRDGGLDFDWENI